jgi:glycosyltransferase involved in cell wall biosynthesis
LKTYTKRIALLCDTNIMIQTGGVYHFIRAYLKMAITQNWKVDVIINERIESKEHLYAELMALNARLLWPKYPHTDHISKYNSFRFALNSSTISNLQMAFLEALQSNIYDYCIPLPETAVIASLLNYAHIPTVFYTHWGESVTGNFTNNFSILDDLSKQCIVATQSAANQAILKTRNIDSMLLPLPFPDPEIFLPQHPKERDGILWVGRFEDRKQPHLFIEAIKKLAVKAIVITSPTSKQKLIKIFKSEGITNYEIHDYVTGNLKRDIFEKARILFMPSMDESFGYVFAEGMALTNAVAFDYRWSKSFDNQYCHIIAKDDKWIDYLQQLYNFNLPPPEGSNDYVRIMHEDAVSRWCALTPTTTLNTNTKNFIDTHRNFWMKDLNVLIKRPLLSIDEISVLIKSNLAGKIERTYTDENTWITVDKQPAPEIPDDAIFGALFG